ncbi:MAG: methyltransferase [Myxococcota bacterium]
MPADPPAADEPIVDAAGAPVAEEPSESESESEPKHEGIAPEHVELDINEPYQENQDAKKWSRRFENMSREVTARQPEILAALAVKPGQVVADVGAGTGLYTLPLAKAVGPEGTVYAVDVQSYFLDHIAKKAKDAGHEHVKLVRAKQDSSGLPEAAVDLVLMVDAYHHIEHPAAYLASLHASLRPGGRLVIVDYRRGSGDSWRHEHIRASPEEFRAEIESAGFELRSTHEGVVQENFMFEFDRR